MADDARQLSTTSLDDTPPGDSSPDGSSPDAEASQTRAATTAAAEPKPRTRRTPPEFEQLMLDPTITGPGKRTEDPYEPGAELRIEGQRGTFVYRYATLSKAGLISLHLTQDGVSRAVRPDQVTQVKKRRSRW